MATNMYMKFEDPPITGSSATPGHAGEIEVLSWNHGFGEPTSPTRSSGEQANHQTMTFTKYLDARPSTNEFLTYSWSGKQIGKATLSCFRSDHPDGGKPILYLTVAMEHVVISNYSVSGGPGDVPVENISLDYGIIKYTYVDQKHADGSMEP
jgi:type VI secretion system secreted protein Hcp